MHSCFTGVWEDKTGVGSPDLESGDVCVRIDNLDGPTQVRGVKITLVCVIGRKV